MSELYSRMDEELEQRLQEAATVGVGFDVPAPKLLQTFCGATRCNSSVDRVKYLS
jgi:hypothetical protein